MRHAIVRTIAGPHCFRKYSAIIRMRYYMSGENTELSGQFESAVNIISLMMSYGSYGSITR